MHQEIHLGSNIVLAHQLVKLARRRVNTRSLHDSQETYYPTLYLPLSVDMLDIWNGRLTGDVVAGEWVLWDQIEISSQTKKAAPRRQRGNQQRRWRYLRCSEGSDAENDL